MWGTDCTQVCVDAGDQPQSYVLVPLQPSSSFTFCRKPVNFWYLLQLQGPSQGQKKKSTPNLCSKFKRIHHPQLLRTFRVKHAHADQLAAACRRHVTVTYQNHVTGGGTQTAYYLPYFVCTKFFPTFLPRALSLTHTESRPNECKANLSTFLRHHPGKQIKLKHIRRGPCKMSPRVLVSTTMSR